MLSVQKMAAIAAGRHFAAPRLVDGSVTFLGLGHGWNDYAAMAVDRSLVGDDVETVVAKTRMHGASPNIPSTNNWSVETVVRLATPTDDTTDRAVWGVAGTAPLLGLLWRFSELRFLYDGVYLAPDNLAPPSLGASPQEYFVSLSVEPNPATTGASDAIIRRARIWNLDTGEYIEHSGSDAIQATPDNLVVGAYGTAGQGAFNGDATAQAAVRYVRISKRARTRAELEAIIPLVKQWPTPEPLASLDTGLLWRPRMSDLFDPVSGLTGTNDGTLYDAALDARNFDTNTDEIGFANVAGPSDFSFACWVRLAAVSGVQRLLYCRRESGAASSPVIYFSGGRLGLFWTYSTTSLNTLAESAAAIGAGQWRHIAATRNGDNATDVHLYVDGVEVTKSTATSGVGTEATSDAQWVLGNLLNSTEFLNGLQADPRAWSRVLTAAEVYNLWQMSRTF